MEINIEYLLKAKEDGLTTDDYINLLLIYKKEYHRIYWLMPHDEVLNNLQSEGYIKRLDDSIDNVVCREKFLKFVPHKIKNSSVKEWFDEWYELIPLGKAGSGLPMRANKQDVYDRMTKFVSKYKYKVEDIFEATKEYYRVQKLDGFRYTMSVDYFIYKQGKGSQLATYCESIKQQQPKSHIDVI